MAHIIGTERGDILRGTPEADVINGGDGHDRLYGGAGDDRLFGGKQRDTLYGGGGADTLFGGRHNDTIHTDAAGPGSLAYGGAETDYFHLNHGADTAYGGFGRDYIYLNPTGEVSHGYDVRGGHGRDDVVVWAAATGVARGGPDIDYLRITRDGFGALTMTREGHMHFVFREADRPEDHVFIAIGFEQMIVHAGATDDFLTGGAQTDWLYGGGGQDTILGNRGNDSVHYVTGAANVLRGGAGRDTLTAYMSDPGRYLVGARGRVDDGFGSDISGFEVYSVHGSASADYIRNPHGRMAGNSGDDSLVGGRGKQMIYGGAGDDLVWGGAGEDYLFGGSGNDTLRSGADYSYLTGGSGDDLLIFKDGGWAAGGTGSDRFVLRGTKDSHQVVYFDDFQTQHDQLHVQRAILAGGPSRGQLPGGAFSPKVTGDSPQFWLVPGGPTRLQELWWDGDGTGDLHDPQLIGEFSYTARIALSDIWII